MIGPLSSRKGSRAQEGFSLVELMIAMTLGLLLVVSVGYVYLGAKTSFNSMDALADIQEGARLAFESMAKDIRMAGDTGGPANGGSPSNVVSDPTTWDPDLKDLFSRPLVGFEEASLPTGILPTGVTPLPGTAVLTVVRADTGRPYSLCLGGDADAACSANNSYDTGTGIGIFTLRFDSCPTADLPQAGQILVASDYTHAAVFQLQQAGGCSSGSMTLKYGPNAPSATPGNSTGDLGPFAGAIKARKLYPLKAATYYIADNAATPAEPTLYRLELGHSGTTATVAPVEVLEGVADLQITYGVDTDATPDGSVNFYWTAAQVEAGSDGSHSMSGVATSADKWKRVLSVRVTLTVQSRAGLNVTTTGGLLSKSFTTTIAIRNRLL